MAWADETRMCGREMARAYFRATFGGESRKSLRWLMKHAQSKSARNIAYAMLRERAR